MTQTNIPVSKAGRKQLKQLVTDFSLATYDNAVKTLCDYIRKDPQDFLDFIRGQINVPLDKGSD